AAATEMGPIPAASGEVPAAVKSPAPLPSRIVTLLGTPPFATARSVFASPLRLAAATEAGPSPAASGEVPAAVKLPVPSPSRIVRLSVAAFATARSVLASPPRLAAATELGNAPAASGEVPAAVKLPAPSPSRIVTSPELPFATARSVFASPLRLAAATE